MSSSKVQKESVCTSILRVVTKLSVVNFFQEFRTYGAYHKNTKCCRNFATAQSMFEALQYTGIQSRDMVVVKTRVKSLLQTALIVDMLEDSQTQLASEISTHQRVSTRPQMPNINPYSTYKMALLSVLYILVDAYFILAGANTGLDYSQFDH